MGPEKHKPHILFVSDLTFAYTIGGTEVASSRLANGLAAGDIYEVSVFSAALNGRNPSVTPDKRIKISRFPLFPFFWDGDFGIFTLPNPVRLTQRMRENLPDCIHIHTPSLLGYFSVKAAKNLGIPCIYTNHIFAEHFVPKTENLWDLFMKYLVDGILSWYMGQFDAVIYPSRIQMDSVHGKYGLKNRAEVISNGFSPLEVAETFDRPDWLKGRTVFLSVSRLTPEKNVHMLVEAFDVLHAHHPQTALVIVGDWAIRQKLDAQVQMKRSSWSIHMLGEKRGNELANCYLWADAFVSASSREAEPVTVLEAVWFAKPLILSDSEGNGGRQFIQGNGYLFRDRDVADLARIMGLFMTDPSLLSIGENGTAILQKYDFTNVVGHFSDLYSDLSNKKQPWSHP